MSKALPSGELSAARLTERAGLIHEGKALSAPLQLRVLFRRIRWIHEKRVRHGLRAEAGVSSLYPTRASAAASRAPVWTP